ncbi:MAG TPA: AmmeMemoRadiSam system radical SAM enzyme [Thermoanaerobaculia bacterium]|nr:AmmeMemoRadiSam system radical SAM enzyme [Thermoanaerobaculia bacterium]HUM29358.1 AmmeMemoRadiSam system radical SAM enzyme [Thermoanaerobaculia bacterium]HXK67604.1 AmmeMemoRadiSam system radical SAM enzyme [Thermoanaerobaculia bacterium]
MVTRRSFLSMSGCACLATMAPAQAQDQAPVLVRDPDREFPPQEARWYKKLPGKRVECELCPNRCRVADRERGTCGVRENRDGTYVTLIHSRVCSVHIDPIEKKPLFHFLPGTSALSLATPGCNMWCKFCQNWQISQFRPEQIDCIHATPETLALSARKSGAPTLAYTYTEPVVGAEYVFDAASAGKHHGLRSVMISNGYIEKDPLKELLAVLDGVKIDLKAFSQKFYEEITGGKLEDILKTILAIKSSRTWLELVVLIIPTLNDSKEEIQQMARWIMKNLGPDTPVHFTRFHPTYRMKNLPSTPIATLEQCKSVADREGLNFVYIGNVPGHPGEHTFCPKCKKPVIRRYGFTILSQSIRNGACAHCGKTLPGVWS